MLYENVKLNYRIQNEASIVAPLCWETRYGAQQKEKDKLDPVFAPALLMM